MSAKLKPFPEEKFGPNLLKLVRSHRKDKVGKWGPEISGLKLKGRGMDWVIVGTNWSGFTAKDTSTEGTWDGLGRFTWNGKFKDAEVDFDWS